MTDVHGRSAFAGTAPKIAIGAAITALLTSVIAVIVVVSRGSGDTAPERTAGGEQPAEGSTAGAAPGEQRVAAADVVKLKRETVTVVRDAGKAIGVKIVDGEVRKSLGLEADDVITALSGRSIKRELDVYDAMLGMSQMDASAVYVDLLRGGKPLLLRWKLDGDLRAARRADTLGSLGGSTRRGLGSLGSGGLGTLGGGSLGGGLGSLGGSPYDPFLPDPDSLADRIKKIDDHNYEVPRATVERVFSSTASYSRIARTIPSYRNEGFRVFGVRPGTIVSAIGIQSGDAVRAINGHEVNSIGEAIDLYQQIKDAKEWRIDITRRGRPELITIAIK
jgi:hypothetical protein